MMLGVVASNGLKMPPYFFKQGLRETAKDYIYVMSRVVKPWIEANFDPDSYIWQQDGAPPHTADATQNWCREKLSAFIPKGAWPPSSPDCAPLDYFV